MNSKIFLQELFLLSSAVLFAVPAVILAENTEATGADEVMEVELTKPPFISEQEEPAAANNGSSKDFCQKFENAASKVDQKVASLESRLAEKRAQTSNKIGQMQAERDQKLSEKRSGWDAKRNEIYAKLESKAGTDEQKQAIIVFKTEIEQAVADRRIAVDKASADFRDGLRQSLENRKSKVDELILNYKKDIASAFEEARSNCQSGTGKKTVRENLVLQLRSAKEQFSSARQEIMMTEFDAANLQVIRRSAADMAVENFRMIFESAKEKLKLSFPGQDI